MNSIKVLILIANPDGMGSVSLHLNAEVRQIEEAIQRSRHRARFQIVAKTAVRALDLRRALVEHRPQIVHFAGHGTEAGLVLENDVGEAQLVSTEALEGLFSIFETGEIECVLLNACYSEAQATAIHQFVDCVIGMNQPIGDQSAIQFAEGFYDALGAGVNYEMAYKVGRSAIALEGSSGYATPVLKNRRRRSASTPKQLTDQALPSEAVTRMVTEPPTRTVQSQSFGNITISGSNSPFSPINTTGAVTLNQTSTQSYGGNSDLEAALELLAKLKQDVSATDELATLAKRETDFRITVLQEELKKPQPDRSLVNDVVEALKQGLNGVLTLAAPVSQVATLLAKAWIGCP
jgi:hypothetical protein